MSFYITAIALALALGALGWGIYLSLKVFNIPDITTDGSYTFGAAISAVHLSSGGSWLPAIFLALLGGFLAGLLTGIIHTRLKVNALLSGILVMTAAYSVNLGLMGKSNIPLIQTRDMFSELAFLHNPFSNSLLILLLLLCIIGGLLAFLLKSDLGLAMRATGNAPEMASSLGIPVKTMKIFGLALANGLTALSGSIMAQYQGFADINMGIGIVIFGLGAVMIGESIIRILGANSIYWKLLGVLAGCMLFRTVIAFTLASGIDPNWLKAITAGIVLVFVAIPQLGTKSMAND